MELPLGEVQRFCNDVISFSFCHFEGRDEFYYQSRYFNFPIGQAVVSLQVYLRDELRVCFQDSIGILTHGLPTGSARSEIKNFLNWYFFKGDIFNLILANLATMVEMIFYLDDMGLQFPNYWFSRVWSLIFRYRFSPVLENAGGWGELTNRARRRYVLSGIYEEMCDVIGRRVLNRYDPVRIHRFERVHALLDFNPAEALLQNLPTMRTTALSMRMMECLYSSEDRLMPNQIFDDLYNEIMLSRRIDSCLGDFPPSPDD